MERLSDDIRIPYTYFINILRCGVPGFTRSAPSAISINTCYNTNGARTLVGGGVGRSRLRIVIVIINDWIYERILKK